MAAPQPSHIITIAIQTPRLQLQDAMVSNATRTHNVPPVSVTTIKIMEEIHVALAIHVHPQSSITLVAASALIAR
jgi:hypothetical protein